MVASVRLAASNKAPQRKMVCLPDALMSDHKNLKLSGLVFFCSSETAAQKIA